MSAYKLPYVNYGGSSGVSPSGITNWGGASDQSNPFGTSNIAASANPLAAAVGGAADALTVGGTTGGTGGTTAANPLDIPEISNAGTPVAGSMAAMQNTINAGESTPDFWSNLEQSNPTEFASIIETAQRGAGIPTGGISTTGANISGSSPQRFLSADFGEGAFFGTDNTPSAMIAPALSAYESTYGHNPWDIDPSTGQQYAFPGQTSVATQQETAHKWAATQVGQNRDATAQSVATQKESAAESAATQAQQNRDATALASRNTTAYNQLAGLGLGGLFTSQDPNYDYTNLISGITGANALSSSDKSTLQDILSNYTQGYSYGTEAQEQLASVIADPQKRAQLIYAWNYYKSNPATMPGSPNSYGSGFSPTEAGQDTRTSQLENMLTIPEYGVDQDPASEQLWNQAVNWASTATPWENVGMGGFLNPGNTNPFAGAKSYFAQYGDYAPAEMEYSLLGGTGPLAYVPGTSAADDALYGALGGTL